MDSVEEVKQESNKVEVASTSSTYINDSKS